MGREPSGSLVWSWFLEEIEGIGTLLSTVLHGLVSFGILGEGYKGTGLWEFTSQESLDWRCILVYYQNTDGNFIGLLQITQGRYVKKKKVSKAGYGIRWACLHGMQRAASKGYWKTVTREVRKLSRQTCCHWGQRTARFKEKELWCEDQKWVERSYGQRHFRAVWGVWSGQCLVQAGRKRLEAEKVRVIQGSVMGSGVWCMASMA